MCFGLTRDDSRKKGQIAHLDRNPSNNNPDNLAWMCLEHHDEYDSRTSQTKSLQIGEVKLYRQELYDTLAHWSSDGTKDELLNYLASSITLEDIVDTAIKVAGRYQALPEHLVQEALVHEEYDSIDSDRWVPYLSLLEDLRSWGLLEFSLKEDQEDDLGRVHIEVKQKPICRDLLLLLEKRYPDLPRKTLQMRRQ